MPSSKKRSSSRSINPKGRYLKSRKRFRSSSSSSSSSFSPAKNLLFNALKTHGPTMLKFGTSYFCKQPLPDKYMTWMTTDVVGFIPAAGVATGSFAHALNFLPTPWSTTGGTGNVIPNPFVAVNSINPAGTRNLLYNASAGTGIYQYYRIWTAVVQYNFTPSSGGDALLLAVSPVLGNTNIFGNITQVGQATNSMIKVINSSVSAEANALVGTYSIPQLLGVSKKDYEATSYGSTYTTNPPVYVLNHVWYQTTDENAFAARCGILITMKLHVEFYGRVDTALLDN